MENSSKALIIAGSVLISILLVSTGIYVYDASKGDAVDKSAEASGKILAQATLEDAIVEENVDNPLAPDLVIAETGDIVTDPEGREWYVLQNNTEVKLILKDSTTRFATSQDEGQGSIFWYNYSTILNEKLNEFYTQPEFAQEMRLPEINDIEEIVGTALYTNTVSKEFTTGEFIKNSQITGGQESEYNSIPILTASEDFPVIVEGANSDTVTAFYQSVKLLNDKNKSPIGAMGYINDKFIILSDNKANFSIHDFTYGVYQINCHSNNLQYTQTNTSNVGGMYITPVIILDGNYQLVADMDKIMENIGTTTGVQDGENVVNYFTIEAK